MTKRTLWVDPFTLQNDPFFGSFTDGNLDRNMNTYKGLNAVGLWPRPQDDWEHSDIVNIAYPFNHQVFEHIVTDGSLQ